MATKKKAPAKKAPAKKAPAKKAPAKKAPAKKASAKKAPVKKSVAQDTSGDASARIDGRIQELDDWRGDTLARLRALIKEAAPEVVEEWKWRGTPVWSDHGILCTGETYKDYIKTTFAKGAALPDPSGLFNSSLEGNTRRAIDFRQGVKIDDKAFKALVRAAVSLNRSK